MTFGQPRWYARRMWWRSPRRRKRRWPVAGGTRCWGGWRDNAFAALDAFSSHRRLLSDPLRLRPALLAAAENGLTFGELAAGSGCEPVARAQLLHLLWRRRIRVDLCRPLTDASPVRAGVGG